MASEKQVERALVQLFEELAQPETDADYIDDWRAGVLAEFSENLGEVWGGCTFEEGGVLTNNAGLTLRLANGAEFQITIVQSRLGKGDLDEDEEA